MRQSPTAVLLLSGLMLVATLLVGATAGAATFSVNDTADLPDAVNGDGLCQTTVATCSLRAAVQEANALPGGDFINVPAGRYVLSILGVGEDGGFTGDLDITEDLTIYGAGVGETIIDANGIDRVFDLPVEIAVSISGVTITGGVAEHSVFPAFLGGGVYIASYAEFEIYDCEVIDNRANLGGGLYAEDGAITRISDCTFRGNREVDLGLATPDGGAIYNSGNMDITRSTITGNAVSNEVHATVASHNAVALRVKNSTIAGNQGTGLGSLNTPLDVVNSTIAGNQYGLFFTAAPAVDPLLFVRNSIISDSAAFDCYFVNGVIDVQGNFNLDSDGSCGLDGPSGDIPATDPLLGPLQDNGGATSTRVPEIGSPVIDAGDDASCETTDQRTAPRPLDGDGVGSTACDIGAVEVLPCAAPWNPHEILTDYQTDAAFQLQACYTITAGPNVGVLSGGLVEFRARDAVIIRNGFWVEPGATFQVVRDPAAGSGMMLP